MSLCKVTVSACVVGTLVVFAMYAIISSDDCLTPCQTQRISVVAKVTPEQMFRDFVIVQLEPDDPQTDLALPKKLAKSKRNVLLDSHTTSQTCAAPTIAPTTAPTTALSPSSNVQTATKAHVETKAPNKLTPLKSVVTPHTALQISPEGESIIEDYVMSFPGFGRQEKNQLTKPVVYSEEMMDKLKAELKLVIQKVYNTSSELCTEE